MKGDHLGRPGAIGLKKKKKKDDIEKKDIGIMEDLDTQSGGAVKGVGGH